MPRRKGSTLTEAHKANISKATMGRAVSLETRIKLRLANKRVISPEQKAKLSRALKGRKIPPAELAKRVPRSGPRHHFWRGGRSREPYPAAFNTKFTATIRKRDGYICQVCGKSQEENGRALDVHHIDSDKSNLCPQNCISLCILCHARTRIDPFFWSVELRVKS